MGVEDRPLNMTPSNGVRAAAYDAERSALLTDKRSGLGICKYVNAQNHQSGIAFGFV